jgi:hypothetical protein
MFFASYYTPNCRCILHIISMSTCITHFIHSKQVLLSIKFLPLHFLILDNFFSCQLHFYLNINNCPPMLGILQTRSVLSPFLCLPCCPSAASCWLRRNGVALRESPTCEFFRSQSGDGFFVCCLFFIVRCLGHRCHRHLRFVPFLLLLCMHGRSWCPVSCKHKYYLKPVALHHEFHKYSASRFLLSSKSHKTSSLSQSPLSHTQQEQSTTTLSLTLLHQIRCDSPSLLLPLVMGSSWCIPRLDPSCSPHQIDIKIHKSSEGE